VAAEKEMEGQKVRRRRGFRGPRAYSLALIKVIPKCRSHDLEGESRSFHAFKNDLEMVQANRLTSQKHHVAL
jgi:hypothetical protein